MSTRNEVVYALKEMTNGKVHEVSLVYCFYW